MRIKGLKSEFYDKLDGNEQANIQFWISMVLAIVVVLLLIPVMF